jgi:hypothetical protein
MELLDRYLQAVKKHLPRERRDDILAELRANLESQLEDKESGLGRPLTQGEAEDWLRQLGAPMQVAARYQPQQYLIGPGMFPTYLYVLKLAMGWATVVYAIVSAVELVSAPDADALAGAVFHLPGVLMTTAAWVTLIFAILEYTAMRYPGIVPTGAVCAPAWSPATLPPVELGEFEGRKKRSFAQAVAEVIFGFLFLIWLLLIPRHPFLLLGPGVVYLRSSPFQFADLWQIQFFWIIVAINIVQLGWRTSALIRGSWQRSRVEHEVVTALSLIPLGFLLTVRDHAYLLLKHPEVDSARYGSTLDAINGWTYKGILIVSVIVVLQLLWTVGKWAQERSREG